MYKIKYMRGGKLRTSPVSFRTKTKARKAIKDVRRMQIGNRLGYAPFKKLRVVKMRRK